MLAIAACGDDGGSDPSGGDGPADSGGDDAQADSSTAGSDDAATGTGSGGSDDATTGPAAPVMCEGIECAPGEICVAPGVGCDYGPCDEDPPSEAEFFTPPRFCSPVPEGCAADDQTCLAGELCLYTTDIPPLTDGVLLCPPEAEDCFCGP